jgi:hypothetical protein
LQLLLRIFRIKIPGIHFQDQKYSNDMFRQIMELMIDTMSQNIQSFNKQNVNSAEYKKAETARRPRGTISGLSPLRSDSSHDSQAGRLDHVRSGQRQLRVAIGLSPLRSNGSCDGQAGRLDKVTVVTKDTESKLRLKFTGVRWFSW